MQGLEHEHSLKNKEPLSIAPDGANNHKPANPGFPALKREMLRYRNISLGVMESVPLFDQLPLTWKEISSL